VSAYLDARASRAGVEKRTDFIASVKKWAPMLSSAAKAGAVLGA